MKAFWFGFREAFRRIFTDFGVGLIMVGAITIYSMYYPLPYLPQVAREMPIAVVDLDQSSFSRRLIRWIDAHENVHVSVRATQPGEAAKALASGEVGGYLIIPAGLRADVLRGRRAVIAYGGDSSRMIVLKQVVSGIAEAAGTLSAGVEVRRLLAAGQGHEQALVAQGPVTPRLHPLFNTREGYGAYLIPAVFILILQQTLVLGVGMMLGSEFERNRNRAEVRVVTRCDAARFVGYCAGLVSLYAAHAAFFVGFGFWLFDVPRYGELVAVAIFLVPFLIASVLFAHLVGGLCRRRETSIHVLLFTSIPILFLTGFAWPMHLMPVPVQWLARLIPSTAGVQGILRLDQMGADFSHVIHWWWNLWILCVLFAWPAWYNWRAAMCDRSGPAPDS